MKIKQCEPTVCVAIDECNKPLPEQWSWIVSQLTPTRRYTAFPRSQEICFIDFVIDSEVTAEFTSLGTFNTYRSAEVEVTGTALGTRHTPRNSYASRLTGRGRGCRLRACDNPWAKV